MITMREVVKSIFAPYRPNTSRTVRFAFPVLFGLATLLGAAVIDSEKSSFIHIESSKTSVREGETFQIGVYVSAHTPVNAVDINLSFSESQVEILGIDTGASVITLWTTEPYVENNSVILQGGTFRRGFVGDHLIATVNARAKATGLASFEVSDVMLLAGDGAGTKVPLIKTGDESTDLYISNAEGLFAVPAKGLDGTVTVRIITDIDGDGDVSLIDLSRFMSAWNSKTDIFDFSGDGFMTFKDFAIILSDVFFK